MDENGTNAAVEEVLAVFATADTLVGLKEAHLVHTSDASLLTLANRLIGTLGKADKPTAGKLLGGARGRITKVLTARQETLEAATKEGMLHTEIVDVIIPTLRTQVNVRHPLDVLIDKIYDSFTPMGRSIAEGPGAEHEWFDFDVLNFDADHPVHQMQDAFYIDGVSVRTAEGQTANLMLRTHTPSVQARVMLEQQPPFYVACSGKVLRSDELDATHTPVLHQVKGLAVDKGSTIAHLKGALSHFAKTMFGPRARTRLRPSFFPFTESSARMDLRFPQKKGGAGWIEQGGCGMVNPNMLITRDIDPEVYTGFAFGMGLEHAFMLHHGVVDMHDIVEGDIRSSQRLGTTGKGN